MIGAVFGGLAPPKLTGAPGWAAAGAAGALNETDEGFGAAPESPPEPDARGAAGGPAAGIPSFSTSRRRSVRSAPD